VAHILIFDSGATVLEDGAEADMSLAAVADEKRSMAVRLFTVKGHIENISYEFLHRGAVGSADADFVWHQQFYNDRSHVGEPDLADGQGNAGVRPGARSFPGTVPGDAWSREHTEEVTAGTGTTDHYPITRQVTMPVNSCAYFPMIVHGMWVRLNISTTTVDFPGRLIIFAVTGGLGATDYLENVLTAPYQYIVQ